MIGKLTGHTSTLNYARKGSYLNFADFDNQLAIDEFCTYKGHKFTLQEMAKIVFIVQHSDKTHCHFYWISSNPMPKRTLEKDKHLLAKIRSNELPAVEIKGAGNVAFAPGGYHESGAQYLPIGTHEILHIEELGDHIHSICKKYNLPVSDFERNKIRRLKADKTSKEKGKGQQIKLDLQEEDWTDIIYDGSRNNTLFDRARNYYRNHKDLLTADNFRKIIHQFNERWCKPELSYFEVDSICNSVLNFYEGDNR
jgi:hypothetical protein